MTSHNMAEAKTSRVGGRMINKRVLPDIFFVPNQLLVTHAKGRNQWQLKRPVFLDACLLYHFYHCLGWSTGHNSDWNNQSVKKSTIIAISVFDILIFLMILMNVVLYQTRFPKNISHSFVSTEPCSSRFLHRLQKWTFFVLPRKTCFACFALNFLPPSKL